MPPQISVIMPAYNAAPFISASIDSVLKQKYSDFELIVVNDGSTDNTKEIVGKIKDERLKYIEKSNGGLPSARNAGLIEARGKYIAYLDSDDFFLEDHLGSLWTFMRDNNLAFAYAKGLMANGQGERTGSMGEVFDKEKLEYCCYFISDMVMHRRDCLERVGRWDEGPELRYCHEDWDFFLRMADLYPPRYLDKETIISIRRGTGQLSRAFSNGAFFSGIEYVVEKRMKKWSREKKEQNGIIAPFPGYYLCLFQNNYLMANWLSKQGIIDNQEIMKSYFLPFYGKMAIMDKNNMESWLVLALINYLNGNKDEVGKIGTEAVKHNLKMPLKNEENVKVVFKAAVKAVIETLGKSGDTETIEKYREISREVEDG